MHVINNTIDVPIYDALATRQSGQRRRLLTGVKKAWTIGWRAKSPRITASSPIRLQPLPFER